MEIQAASGEWMNEFVRRPSKRRDNRGFLPTADIIKRTIRRSWTISNPTPRWSTLRSSPEFRPYSSLPRNQDISNYPSLEMHQSNPSNKEPSAEKSSPPFRRRSPRRTQSEDIYDEQCSTYSYSYRGSSPLTFRGNSPETSNEKFAQRSPETYGQRPVRINPLIRRAEQEKERLENEKMNSPPRRSAEGSSEDGSSKEDDSPKSKGILTPEPIRRFERPTVEKRVSFDSHLSHPKPRPSTVLRAQSLMENHVPNRISLSLNPSNQEVHSDNSEEAGATQPEREDVSPIETCDIEPFSGTVFRKMMVRRRRPAAKKANGAANSTPTTPENGWRRGPDTDLWDILLPEGDDYKLVFINSSDGSSKEESYGSSREEDDNDSSSTASSFPIDECDWDYFEPGSRPAPVINFSSPFGSPRVYRRGVVESPIGSPLVYRRRMRESDTGTDEDNNRQDSGSPASSDSIFHPRSLTEEQFDNPQQPQKTLDDTTALQCLHQDDISSKPSCHTCGATTQYIPIPVPVPIPFPVPALWPPHEPPLMVFGEQRFRVLPRNLWSYLNQAALIWPAFNNSTGGTTMPATTDRDACSVPSHKEPDALPVVEADEITGYLECENRYVSSSDSSDTSDSSKPRVRRVYNVSGTDRLSDDALPSSNVTSDCDEEDGRMSQSSVREDDMTSSGSADTDSDDTGTVADQKPKRFSRVFVVNKNLSSSSNSSSCSSDTDSSDNDTDTEMDCTVILTNMKQLDEEGDKLSDNQICDKNPSDKNSEIPEDENKTGYVSSPGLSDVSAESVNSSDVDQVNDTVKETISSQIKEENELSELNYAKKKEDHLQSHEAEDNLVNESKRDFDDISAENVICKQDEIKKSFSEIVFNKSDENYVADSIETDETRPFSFNSLDQNDKNKETKTTKGTAMEYIENKRENEDKNDDNVYKTDEHEGDVYDLTEIFKQVDKSPSEKDIPENDIFDSYKYFEINVCVPKLATHKFLIAERITTENNEFSLSADNKKQDGINLSDVRPSSQDTDQSALDGESRGQNIETNSNDEIPIGDISCPAAQAPQLMDIVLKGETAEGAKRTLGEWNEIRSGDAVNVEGKSLRDRGDGVQPGEIVYGEVFQRHAAARYTSLVMITQDTAPNYQQVSVVTSDTTTLVPGNDVVVKHTNWQVAQNKLEQKTSDNQNQDRESVTVITGGDTLSAFEEGLADDDSWVENLSHDEEDEDEFATNSGTEDSSSGEEVTLTCSAAIDHEENLRGYHRSAIDFTLHTIVEESCEESEVEQNAPKKKERPASATDLEKYFFFGLGDGMAPSLPSNRDDAFSETSSIYSEGMESLGGSEEHQTSNDNSDPAELASSRLEKYFLSGFMGFTAERRDSDGSVGSDSEGRPSPEQRRKRLVRARGTGRSHSSSLDNLDNAISEQTIEAQMSSEDSSSSDFENYEDNNSFEKPDGQFDTVKRKKNKKPTKNPSSADESKSLETTQEMEEKDSETDDDGHKTPQPEIQTSISNLTTTKNQQSRDSGFVGSCDDLLREQRDNITPDLSSFLKVDLKTELEDITEEKKVEDKVISVLAPPATSLSRKDSFNNWSSDEETNLMMCKMRQFFKTMVANSQLSSSSKPSTPNLGIKPLPSPRAKRCKPPQLVYFENELTRLMKTVPGIRDDQVREIVEYLSSEDTWSDSYDSSDYTSSDLEITTSKTVLQQQISDSCKQIINKFDNRIDDEGDEGDGGIIDESHGLNKETAFVYQKLVASFEKMATGDTNDSTSTKVTPHNSPPLIAKVMHHIGSRLVALMHEVSSGESHASNSPKTKHYHRRLQHKISSASSTTTEDDCPEGYSDFMEENHIPYNLLPRSKSHDLLVSENRILHQSTSGVSDIAEEKETSDCERFSWRGSFESALLATDSRNKLSLLGGEVSASASALAIAAKRRSAGDLLFSHKSLSREQLDRVRSCGSIGGANSEDKLWVSSGIRPNRRRSSVPDASCGGSGGSADGEDEDEDIESRSTLPRSLQGGTPTTNSLPRLPTTSNIQKSQSHHVLTQNVKSARYRPPGFNRLTSVPKRAVSAPGLQPSHQRRGRRSQQTNVPTDEAGVSEAHSSPMLTSTPKISSKGASASPVTPGIKRNGSKGGQDWHHEDDFDRLGHGRASLSTLGARSDSMASVYSGAGEGRYGTVAVKGQVEFGLQYNYKAGALEIQIKQCKDLAPVDTKRSRSDPYVKVYLLPDKSKSGKRKTKVKKHTLNPVFDECLRFHMSLKDLETRTLWLTVWHSDMFGRNDFLGEVMMTLENKVFDDPTPKWYNLQERTEPFEDVPTYRGDVIVCLKFVPPDMTVQKKGKRSRGTLHVLIKEAKCLTAVKANGSSDPFCKSYLLPDKGRSSKQKTPVAKRTTNPVWNYTFVYDDVTLQELSERCLELTIWDHDRLASNEFLGGVRFSLGTGKHHGKAVDWMDSTGRELSLWKDMLEKPNFWVEGCLSLRSTLESRGS